MTEDSLEVCGTSDAEVTQKSKRKSLLLVNEDVGVKVNTGNEKKKKKKKKSAEDEVELEATEPSPKTFNIDRQKEHKKKKKKKASKELIEYKTEVVENEGDDAAESIDSGFIADSNSDTSSSPSQIDWSKVKASLLGGNGFLSNLLACQTSQKVTSQNILTSATQKETQSKKNEKVEGSQNIKSEPIEEAVQGTSGEKKKKRPAEETAEGKAEAGKPSAKRVKFEEDEEKPAVQNKLKNLKNVKDTATIQELKDTWLERLAEFRKKAKRGTITSEDIRTEQKIRRKLANLEIKKRKVVKKEDKVKVKEEEESTSKGGKGKTAMYNQRGQLVFSKFDFSATTPMDDIETTLTPKNVQAMLAKALKEKEKLKQMENKSATSAVSMREKKAWELAMQKAEGGKVRDDVEKLRHCVKVKKKRKKVSAKKWDQRIKTVQKNKEERQAKRKRNLKMRKDKKLEKKMTKMKKKGHFVPGF